MRREARERREGGRGYMWCVCSCCVFCSACFVIVLFIVGVSIPLQDECAVFYALFLLCCLCCCFGAVDRPICCFRVSLEHTVLSYLLPTSTSCLSQLMLSHRRCCYSTPQPLSLYRTVSHDSVSTKHSLSRWIAETDM